MLDFLGGKPICAWNRIGVVNPASSNTMLTLDAVVEANEYLPSDTPGHGYTGYVNTTISDPSFMQEDSDLQKLTSQLISHTGGDAGRDINALDPDRDQATGVFAMASQYAHSRHIPCLS